MTAKDAELNLPVSKNKKASETNSEANLKNLFYLSSKQRQPVDSLSYPGASVVRANGLGGTLSEHPYLIDFIPINFSPRKIDRGKLGDLYLKNGFSSAQIADQVGLSKQAVLSRLREQGIHKTLGRGRSPDNFRYPYPIYGYHVVGGRLTTFAKEMKAVRLIVELRDRKARGWEEIVDHLNQRGFRSRTDLPWNRVRVKRVHKHWTGKI